MPITNAQAVQFSNAQIRQLADALASAYWTSKAVVANYYASPELGTEYTNGIAETIVDGSETDGRQPVTGNDALGMITRASELINWLEGTTNMTEVGARDNGELNVVLGYAVNGRSRL